MLHKEFVDPPARGVLTGRPGSVQLVGGDVEQGHLPRRVKLFTMERLSRDIRTLPTAILALV
jgi:hypothetical protein